MCKTGEVSCPLYTRVWMPLGWGGWVYTCIKCDHMTVLYIYIGSTAAHAGWAWPAWSLLRGPASWRGTRTGGTDGGQQWVCPPGLQQEGGQSRTCGHTTCTSASQHHSKGTIYSFLHHFTSFPLPSPPFSFPLLTHDVLKSAVSSAE